MLLAMVQRPVHLSLLLVGACVGQDPRPAPALGIDGGEPPLVDASAEAAVDAARSCTRRSGTFVAKFSEKVGTCGPYRAFAGSDTTEETYTDQPDRPAPPCTGFLRASSDNCSTTIETSCPSSNASTFETRGVLEWNDAGTSAAGDLEVRTPTCKGTYQVVVTRR
jgi:hypothetical protein